MALISQVKKLRFREGNSLSIVTQHLQNRVRTGSLWTTQSVRSSFQTVSLLAKRKPSLLSDFHHISSCLPSWGWGALVVHSTDTEHLLICHRRYSSRQDPPAPYPQGPSSSLHFFPQLYFIEASFIWTKMPQSEVCMSVCTGKSTSSCSHHLDQGIECFQPPPTPRRKFSLVPLSSHFPPPPP